MRKKLMYFFVIGMLPLGVKAQQNTFPSSGNVGIGTTTPVAALEVNGEAHLDGNLSVGNGTAGDVVLYRSDGAGPFVGSYNSAPLRFGTTYAERMRITATGYVGIGTTNPTAVLQVVNSVNADGQVGFQVNQATGGDLDLTAARIQSTDDGNYIRFLHKTTSWPNGDYIDANGLFNVKYSGNVGIGTSVPAEKLEVSGNVKISGGGAHIIFPDGSVQDKAWNGTLCGGDYAESVDVKGERTQYEPGDVLVVDPQDPGKFLKSSEPYSMAVSGVYSTKPGLIGRRQTTDPKTSTSEVPMAMVGIVPTKVSAENGPIHPGDILVTSSTLGHAMKGTDRGQFVGAIVGKALGTLDSGTGVIEVLISLQ